MYDDVELNAKQHTYKSHPTYSVSDHKPVTGVFDIMVKIIYIYIIIIFLPHHVIMYGILCSDQTYCNRLQRGISRVYNGGKFCILQTAEGFYTEQW